MPQQPPSYLVIFQIVLIGLIFYFLLYRPQKAEQKKRQEMISKLNKNDEIITSSGIHGTVVAVKDKTVLVRIDDDVKMELEKAAIAEITRKAVP